MQFLDRQSVYTLRDQATSSLEALYEGKIVVNMVSGVIKKSMYAHESENEIVLTYPRLATGLPLSQMIPSYKCWLQELSPRFPDFKNLVLAGAVYISIPEWYLSENINKPVNLLVQDLDTKGFVFTPQDILDFFKWKTVNCRDSDSSFQKLLHGAFELCKSHVFKGMLRCQKTSFSTVGNSAQLVSYNWNQKELASFDGKTIYCDLLPQAKSEIMGTVDQGSTANIAHMFGIANEVKYLPMYEGTLNHDVQQARIAFLSQDFLPEYLSR